MIIGSNMFKYITAVLNKICLKISYFTLASTLLLALFCFEVAAASEAAEAGLPLFLLRLRRRRAPPLKKKSLNDESLVNERSDFTKIFASKYAIQLCTGNGNKQKHL